MYKHRLTLMSLNGLTASIIEQIRKYVKTCHLCVNSIYFEGICAFFLIELGRVKKKKKKDWDKTQIVVCIFYFAHWAFSYAVSISIFTCIW